MPDEEEFDFKKEALSGHRQQTQLVLAEIRTAETWFYTGSPDKYTAKHLYDFIGDVGHGHWLLFTECHWSRKRTHRMFDTVPGQEYQGCLVRNITRRYLVEDEIINIPSPNWMRMQSDADRVGLLFTEPLVKPKNQWLECADVTVAQNNAEKTFHLLMFGLASYQAAVLMGAHRIFPQRVIQHE